MSKKSKKIRKALMGAAALYGASKLKGVMDSRAMRSSVTADSGHGLIKNKDYGPYVKTPIKKGKNLKDGITQLKESELKKFSLKKDGSNPTRNMKSIFVQDDGSIIKGTTKYKDKKTYANRDKSAEGGSEGLKSFMNKYVLGEKSQMKKKGGILKAKGGVEVNTRLNGKLYTQTF